MVKALARAFRWRKMLDEGVYATLEDLARAKGVNATYVSRVLRLTLLAPEIVEAILDGRQPAEMQLDDLLKRFPLAWECSARLVDHRSLAGYSTLGDGRTLPRRSSVYPRSARD